MKKNKKMTMAAYIMVPLLLVGTLHLASKTSSGIRYQYEAHAHEVITLDSTHNPTNSTEYVDEVAYTGIAYATYTYTKVKASAGNLAELNKDGTLTKDLAKGLTEIKVRFTGSLTLKTWFSPEDSDKTTYELVDNVTLPICGNYFLLLANEVTTITSVTVHYSCYEESPGHNFVTKSIVDPTTEAEGTHIEECEICGVEISKKILKLPSFSMSGKTVSWTAIENATGYFITLGQTKHNVGNATSYTVTDASIFNQNISVVAYTNHEDYYNYDTVQSVATLVKDDTNIQANLNSDFSNNGTIRLDRNESWDNHPYANFSDLDGGGNGGHYYIYEEEDGNMAAKVPAVVWWPGNTTLKRDLGNGTFGVGEYEISFDIKASERALSLNDNGVYGKISGYLWNNNAAGDLLTIAGTTNIFNDPGLRITNIDGISTTGYTNVRLRYTLNDAVDHNQLNVIYWPEAGIGEDNYVMIDNIKVFKVVDGEVGTVNVDNNIGGDFEAWSLNSLDHNHWYANNTILVENSALGSSIIDEDGNKALKIHANSAEAAFNLRGNAVELTNGGLFEMSIKVKKGTSLTNPAFGFTMWAFGDVTQQLTGNNVINITSANESEYTTFTVKFFTNALSNIDTVNIYFWVGLGNASGDDDQKYIIIDDVEISRVSLTNTILGE